MTEKWSRNVSLRHITTELEMKTEQLIELVNDLLAELIKVGNFDEANKLIDIRKNLEGPITIKWLPSVTYPSAGLKPYEPPKDGTVSPPQTMWGHANEMCCG